MAALVSTAWAFGARADGGLPSVGAWLPFFGAFHILALHLPIGFLALAALFEFWPASGAGLRRAAGIALGWGALAAWLTSALGLMRAQEGGYDAGVLAWHRGLGLTLAGAATVCWLGHRRLERRSGAGRSGFRWSLGAMLACLTAAAHEGGSLTHGSKFLVEHAPAGLAEWLGSSQARAFPRVPAGDAGVKLFRDLIQPTLERKCYSCHGAEKQKGGLRLDQRASAVAPRKDGPPALTPGDALKSEVARRILLPAADDDAMPPSGKEGLTDSERGAILRWIQFGAPYGDLAPP